MKHLSYRLGNLELRNTGDGLAGSENPTTMEIVLWGDNKICLTIAYWTRDFDLVFVGNRPFYKDVDKLDFLKLAEAGQKHLVEQLPSSPA